LYPDLLNLRPKISQISVSLKRMEKKFECKIGSSGEGMIAKIAGGSNVMDSNNTFSIGNRNVEATLSILGKYGIKPISSDTGGSLSRTVSVSVKTGKVIISCPGKGDWEI